jgi:hypothetical protein
VHGAPFSLYFHVWELDPAQPRIRGAGALTRLRHYRNLDRMEDRLRALIVPANYTGYAEYLGIPLSARQPRPTAVTHPIVVRGYTAPALSARRDVTVVVPCFNEEEALPYLLNTLERVATSLSPSYKLHFLFVDDCSTDGTFTALERSATTRLDARVIRHDVNRGVAHAILTGIRASRTEFVCSIDADCTYDPHQLGDLLTALERGADLVTASPYHPNGRVRHVPSWRLLLSRTLSRIYRRELTSDLHTYTSCFRAYRRDAFADLKIVHRGFLGIAEFLARAILGGARVVEVPATLEVRLLGNSKMKIARVALGHLGLLRDLRRWRRAGLLTQLPRRSVRGASVSAPLEGALRA